MVVRTRLGSFLKGLALYAVAALLVGYFAFHAYHGNHGIVASRAFEQEAAQLERERNELRAEREVWERRIALLKPESLDPDLVDELARRDLFFAHPSDLVVLRPAR
ncbi:MAG TPA: septum formation initiator family protein [Xanthobacteraceae bacterium]|jgi:cell division protein FtsB